MPTYDYRCNACGHEFELFQKMTDKPKRKCPSCAKDALERLIGVGAAVIFKGSGFYETDYRSESYKKAAEADKKTTAAAETKSNAACACAAGPASECAGSTAPKPAEKAEKASKPAKTRKKSNAKNQ